MKLSNICCQINVCHPTTSWWFLLFVGAATQVMVGVVDVAKWWSIQWFNTSFANLYQFVQPRAWALVFRIAMIVSDSMCFSFDLVLIIWAPISASRTIDGRRCRWGRLISSLTRRSRDTARRSLAIWLLPPFPHLQLVYRTKSESFRLFPGKKSKKISLSEFKNLCCLGAARGPFYSGVRPEHLTFCHTSSYLQC